jgi:hypothetical protein
MVSLARTVNLRTTSIMPKRKRGQYRREEPDPTKELELKKVEIAKKLVHGKKVLHRALKTAKGFERQKLGKRIKLATEKQDAVGAGKLERELNVLKVYSIICLRSRKPC